MKELEELIEKLESLMEPVRAQGYDWEIFDNEEDFYEFEDDEEAEIPLYGAQFYMVGGYIDHTEPYYFDTEEECIQALIDEIESGEWD